MKRIYAPTSSALDWQRLLARPDRHWKAGYSAMALARCWEDAGDCLPSEVEALLAATPGVFFDKPRLLLAVPEFQVELPGGSRPTQTDLFALVRSDGGLTAVAVEGKVEESFGPTIEERSRDGAAERLDYLHDLLRLDRARAPNLRYQLLHRTAAAVLLAREFNAHAAEMIVHSFSPTFASWSDFANFCEALGAKAGRDRLVHVGDHDGRPLFLGWAIGGAMYREPIPTSS